MSSNFRKPKKAREISAFTFIKRPQTTLEISMAKIQVNRYPSHHHICSPRSRSANPEMSVSFPTIFTFDWLWHLWIFAPDRHPPRSLPLPRDIISSVSRFPHTMRIWKATQCQVEWAESLREPVELRKPDPIVVTGRNLPVTIPAFQIPRPYFICPFTFALICSESCRL